jgi:hypothetical protein
MKEKGIFRSGKKESGRKNRLEKKVNGTEGKVGVTRVSRWNRPWKEAFGTGETEYAIEYSRKETKQEK